MKVLERENYICKFHLDKHILEWLHSNSISLVRLFTIGDFLRASTLAWGLAQIQASVSSRDRTQKSTRFIAGDAGGRISLPHNFFKMGLTPPTLCTSLLILYRWHMLNNDRQRTHTVQLMVTNWCTAKKNWNWHVLLVPAMQEIFNHTRMVAIYIYIYICHMS